MPKYLNRKELLLKQSHRKKKTYLGHITKGGPSTSSNKYNAFNHFKPVCDINTNYIITMPMQSFHSTILRKINSHNFSDVNNIITEVKNKLRKEIEPKVEDSLTKQAAKTSDKMQRFHEKRTIKASSSATEYRNILTDTMNISTNFNNKLNLGELLGLVFNPSNKMHTCPDGLYKGDHKLGIFLGTITKPIIIPVQINTSYHTNTLFKLFLDNINNLNNVSNLSNIKQIVNLIAWRGSMSPDKITFKNTSNLVNLLMNKVYHEHLFITTRLTKLTKDANGYILDNNKLYENNLLNLLASRSIFDSSEINGPIGPYADNKVKTVLGFDTENEFNKGSVINIPDNNIPFKDIPDEHFNSFHTLSSKYIMNKSTPKIKYPISEEPENNIYRNGIEYKTLIKPVLNNPDTKDNIFGYQWIYPTVYGASYDIDGNAVYTVTNTSSSQNLMDDVNIIYYDTPPLLKCEVYSGTTNDYDQIKTIITELNGAGIPSEASAYHEDNVIASIEGYLPLPDKLNNLSNSELENKSTMFDFLILASLSNSDADAPANKLFNSSFDLWCNEYSVVSKTGTTKTNVINNKGEYKKVIFNKYEYKHYAVYPKEIKLGYKLVNDGKSNFKLKKVETKTTNLKQNGIIKDRIVLEQDIGANKNFNEIQTEGHTDLLGTLGTMCLSSKRFSVEDARNDILRNHADRIDTFYKFIINDGIIYLENGENNENYQYLPQSIESVFKNTKQSIIDEIRTNFQVKDIRKKGADMQVHSLVDAFIKVLTSPFSFQQIGNGELTITQGVGDLLDGSTVDYYKIHINASTSYNYMFKRVNIDVFQIDESNDTTNLSNMHNWLSEFDMQDGNTLLPVGILFKLDNEYITADSSNIIGLFNLLLEIYTIDNGDPDLVDVREGLDLHNYLTRDDGNIYVLYRYASSHTDALYSHYYTMKHLLDSILYFSNIWYSTMFLGLTPSNKILRDFETWGQYVVNKDNDKSGASTNPRSKNDNSNVVAGFSKRDIWNLFGKETPRELFIPMVEFYSLEQITKSKDTPLYPIALGEKEFPIGAEIHDIKEGTITLPELDIVNPKLENMRSGDLIENFFPRIGYRFWGKDINEILGKPTYRRLLLGGVHDPTNMGALTVDGNLNLNDLTHVSGYENAEEFRKKLIENNKNAKHMGQGYLKPASKYTSVYDEPDMEITGQYSFDMELNHLSIRPVMNVFYKFDGILTAIQTLTSSVNNLNFKWKGWTPTHFSTFTFPNFKDIKPNELNTTNTNFTVTNESTFNINYILDSFITKETNINGVMKKLSQQVYSSSDHSANTLIHKLVIDPSKTIITELNDGLAANTIIKLNELPKGDDLIFSGKAEAYTYAGLSCYPIRFMDEKKYLTNNDTPTHDQFVFSTAQTGWTSNSLLDIIDPMLFMTANTNVALSKRRAIISGIMALHGLINKQHGDNELVYQKIHDGTLINKFAGLYRKTITRKIPVPNGVTEPPNNRDVYIYTYIPEITGPGTTSYATNCEPSVDVLSAINPFKFLGYGGIFNAFSSHANALGTQYVDYMAAFDIFSVRTRRSSAFNKARINMNNRYTHVRVELFSRLIDKMQTIAKSSIGDTDCPNKSIKLYMLENILFWDNSNIDLSNSGTIVDYIFKIDSMGGADLTKDESDILSDFSNLTGKKIATGVYGEKIITHISKVLQIKSTVKTWLIRILDGSFKVDSSSFKKTGIDPNVSMKISILSIYALNILKYLLQYSMVYSKNKTLAGKMYHTVVSLQTTIVNIFKAEGNSFVKLLPDMFMNIDPMALNTFFTITPHGTKNNYIIFGKTDFESHNDDGYMYNSTPKNDMTSIIRDFNYGSRFVNGFVSSLIITEFKTINRKSLKSSPQIVPSYFGTLADNYDYTQTDYLSASATNMKQLSHILIGSHIVSTLDKYDTDSLKTNIINNTNPVISDYNLLTMAGIPELIMAGVNILDVFRSYLTLLYQLRRITNSSAVDAKSDYANFDNAMSTEIRDSINKNELTPDTVHKNIDDLYLINNEKITKRLLDKSGLNNYDNSTNLKELLYNTIQPYFDNFMADTYDNKVMYRQSYTSGALTGPRQGFYEIYHAGPMGILPVENITYNSKSISTRLAIYNSGAKSSIETNQFEIPNVILNLIYSLLNAKVFVGVSKTSITKTPLKLNITGRIGEGGIDGGTNNDNEYKAAALAIRYNYGYDGFIYGVNNDHITKDTLHKIQLESERSQLHITSDAGVNIVTWNLKNFPSNGNDVPWTNDEIPPEYDLKNQHIRDTILELPENQQPDVLCLQEVWDIDGIKKMLANMGYNTIISYDPIDHWDGLIIASHLPLKKNVTTSTDYPAVWRLNLTNPDKTAHFMDASIPYADRKEHHPPRMVLACELVLPKSNTSNIEKTIIVYNVHLKSNIGDNNLLIKETRRVSTKLVLSDLENQSVINLQYGRPQIDYIHDNIVICGDFNTIMNTTDNSTNTKFLDDTSLTIIKDFNGGNTLFFPEEPLGSGCGRPICMDPNTFITHEESGGILDADFDHIVISNNLFGVGSQLTTKVPKSYTPDTWNSGQNYNKGTIILHQGIVSVARSEHKSNTTDLIDNKLPSTLWKSYYSYWSHNTVGLYYINDLALYWKDYKVYRCIAQHLPNDVTFAPDGTNTKWELYADYTTIKCSDHRMVIYNALFKT